MTPELFRSTVLATLKSERGVTDVAFTPLGHGNEQVSFYEKGVRAHFAVTHEPYETKETLAEHVKLFANVAMIVAQEQRAAADQRLADEQAKNAERDRVKQNVERIAKEISEKKAKEAAA